MYYRFFVCLSITILLIFTSCIKHLPDNKNNDLDQWKLRGNVKTLSEINYSKSGKYKTNISFNKDGYVLEQSSFNPDGSLIRKWKYDYDSFNHKQKRYCYVLRDSLSYILKYYYNNKEKLISLRISDIDTISKLRTTIFYDDNQNIIEENTFGQKLNLEQQVKYSFDSNNRVIEENHIDSLNNQQWKQKYTYNVNGTDEEIAYFSAGNNLLKRVTYKYIKKKNPSLVSYYDAANKLVSTTEYAYNHYGDAIEIIEKNIINKQQNIQISKYKYDKNGNWTFLSEYKNQNPENLITRELKYYK